MAYEFPETIFATSLNHFVQCPFRFRCHNDKDVKAIFKPSPEQFVGDAVHGALRLFFDINEVPIHERRPEAIGDLVRIAWARVTKGFQSPYTAEERIALFGSVEQERAQGLAAIDMLKSYLSTADLSVVPIALEDWQHAAIDGVRLGGKIDRVDKEGDERIAVWDYKTGKLPYHRTVEKIVENDFQLPVYALIAEELYPFAGSLRVGFIYIKYSQVFDVVWDRDDLAAQRRRVLDVIETIRGEDEFRPVANRLCPWCDYLEICPKREEIEGAAARVDEVSW
jgi:putative RecB family exonuclease